MDKARPMTRRLLILLLLACALSGCGTLTDTLGDKRKRRRDDGITASSLISGGRVRIYGGVIYDFEVLAEAKAGWLLVLYLVDIPFSAVVDTLLLPVTVTYNLTK